jgi:hypothetical protein
VHVIIAISKGLEVGEERSGPWPLGGRRFSFFSFYASSLAFGVRRKDTAALKGQKKKKKKKKKERKKKRESPRSGISFQVASRATRAARNPRVAHVKRRRSIKRTSRLRSRHRAPRVKMRAVRDEHRPDCIMRGPRD